MGYKHERRYKRKRVRRGVKKRMASLSKEVNFYYVNINGYKSKSDCLKQIIYEQSVDVLLVTETKVYSNSSVKLSGYQVYPVVRHKSQGVVCSLQ